MTPERWQEVKQLYHAVLEGTPSLRSELLASAHPEVRREVESLLSLESGPGPFDKEVWRIAEPTKTLTQLGTATQLGQYEMKSLLGRGGMGEVYLAHDPKLGRDVAIKTLPTAFSNNSEHLSRFRREARVLASLNHPNIGAIFGLEEANGVHFLVLELVPGETLAERLSRSGPVPIDEAVRIMGQVGDALEAAHRQGVTHRDIKPANIKVTPEGRVKVLDFGLAKVFRSEATHAVWSGAASETVAGRIMGTPRYMSPEQARGQEVDHRTDIWAFGCVFYEVLTAKPALSGKTVSDIIAGILERQPDFDALPADTPDQIRGLIERCLQKDAGKRIPDITEVSSIITEAQARPRRSLLTRRGMVMGGGALAAVSAVALAVNRQWFGSGSEIRSIAVLPLTNLSGDPQQEYFSEGMTESLITALAQIGALKVISRTSVMSYKDAKKPLREIAEELGVDAILEGSAMRSGGRIRISVQLIDTRTDQHLWAESYDREFADALVLQGEVARSVAQQVRAQLSPQEQTRLNSARPVNPEAHTAYLQGKFLVNRPNVLQNLTTAQTYFEASLQRDPDYALAHAGLAWLWVTRLLLGDASREEATPKAVESAEKALALDSSLAEVHNTLAVLKAWVRWDWAEAEASFRKAIELDSNYPDARIYYARLLSLLKRIPEAIPQAERALELDPLNALFRAHYAHLLNFAGRYDDAITQSQRALASEPDQQQAQNALRTAYFHKGMLREALDVALRRTRTPKGNKTNNDIRESVQRVYDEGKYEAAAQLWAESVEARWRQGLPAPGLPVFFTLARQPDKLLEWYEWAIERDSNMPEGARAGGRDFPQLEANPRYQALLRRMSLP